MFYQKLLLTILLLIKKTTSDHISKNDTDVIVTYAGHVDAQERISAPKTEKTTEKSTTTHEGQDSRLKFTQREEKEEVVFVPNEKEEEKKRNERDEFMHAELVKVEDVIDKKTIDDIISGRFKKEETEEPPGDIMFISGKNKEEVEKPSRITDSERERHGDTIRRTGTEDTETPKIKLDCKNLDCNNTRITVCGGKMEHKHWKYRLFLNECYFRKVNCNFNYEINRYTKVQGYKCLNVGAHQSERPNVYRPRAPPPIPDDMVVKRRVAERRAMSVNLDGSMCSHTCPLLCTEEYDPECAISDSGVRKVFENHCKLDLHSCRTESVWRRRQLLDCVGSRKADIRQNRAFIGWMQYAGIVDSKGKLVVS